MCASHAPVKELRLGSGDAGVVAELVGEAETCRRPWRDGVRARAVAIAAAEPAAALRGELARVLGLHGRRVHAQRQLQRAHRGRRHGRVVRVDKGVAEEGLVVAHEVLGPSPQQKVARLHVRIGSVIIVDWIQRAVVADHLVLVHGDGQSLKVCRVPGVRLVGVAIPAAGEGRGGGGHDEGDSFAKSQRLHTGPHAHLLKTPWSEVSRTKLKPTFFFIVWPPPKPSSARRGGARKWVGGHGGGLGHQLRTRALCRRPCSFPDSLMLMPARGPLKKTFCDMVEFSDTPW